MNVAALKWIFFFVFLLFFHVSHAKMCSQKNTKLILTETTNIVEILRDLHEHLVELRDVNAKGTLKPSDINAILSAQTNRIEHQYTARLDTIKDTIKQYPECNILDLPDLKKTK